MVTPSDDVTLEVEDERQYTVSNPVADTEHTIALLPAGNVSIDADGVVTFTDDDENGVADDLATTDAYITVVNGTSTGNATGDDFEEVLPAGGEITFTVTSDVAENVVPVVFYDADGGNDLDLNEDEVFGVGGATRWIPEEASGGAFTITAGDISAVEKGADYFVGDPGTGDVTYNYDSNDNFQIDGVPVTMTEFEAELSVGDGMLAGSTYATNPDLSSTFNLDDATPEAPDVTAAVDGEGSNEITVDVSGVTDFQTGRDSITVYQTPSSDDNATAGNCADDTYAAADQVEVGTFTAGDDEDDVAANIQLTITADPADAEDGCYEYVASVTVDGEESDTGAAATAQSTADTTPPTLDAATPNDINNGVGSTNEVIVTFSEPVSSVTIAEWVVYPTAQAGLEIDVTAASQRNTTGTQWTITLAQSLDDATTDISYTIDVDAEGFADAAGNDSAAGETTTFDY